MIDLRTHPRWQAEDLGKPIPDSPHAVSVAFPLWEHVEQYEQGDPRVLNALACGYPRFVYHPRIEELSRACEERFAGEGSQSLPFPSAGAAQRCRDYLERKAQCRVGVDALGLNGIHAVTFPAELAKTVKKFWQHTGDTVSSRLAEATLAGRGPDPEGVGAKNVIKKRIAEHTGQSADDIFLFPTGMAAISAAHRLLQERAPGVETVQLGFPYADLLKVQDEIGPGMRFFPNVDPERLDAVAGLLEDTPVAGLFTEFPGNPLLQSPDIPRLSPILRQQDVPLIIDDTLGAYINIDPFPYADIVTTSLTKFFSGAGDVMAGALILNGASPYHARFAESLGQQHEDQLWSEDAVVLEQNSRDFPARMAQINATTETVCKALKGHPAVEELYYPKYETVENYHKLLRTGGGYGGLFSILLKNAEETSRPFYDALRVSKGPSLGTDYTLACPYTLLAHYDELDWAASHGISPCLVRVSIGLEDPADLIARFHQALPR